MAEQRAPMSQDEIAARRRRARRTALWLGALAVAVYIGFIVLTGTAVQ